MSDPIRKCERHGYYAQDYCAACLADVRDDLCENEMCCNEHPCAECGSLPTTCEWFRGCTCPATGVTPHPVLGDVPTCDQCAAFARG